MVAAYFDVSDTVQVIQASAGPHELHIPERTQISIATEASPTSPSTALTGEVRLFHRKQVITDSDFIRLNQFTSRCVAPSNTQETSVSVTA